MVKKNSKVTKSNKYYSMYKKARHQFLFSEVPGGELL